MLPLLVTVYSYLLGSIPFGYILILIFHGKDIRETGSGNIGATNVSRTSPKLGALTLILDMLKGIAAVAITRSLFPGQTILLGLAAVAAIFGHIFPIWLKFHGGKGVATGLGSFVLIVPKIILLMIGIFAVIFLIFRYVSLASIITLALFPVLAWILQPSPDVRAIVVFMAAASLLIIARHHENIRRLLAHTEPRFQRRRR
jgi:acyl phosphate:glycerol-3-phosphate acyltransferase